MRNFHSLTREESDLFALRRNELEVARSVRQALEHSRAVATDMTSTVAELVTQVQNQSHDVQNEMRGERTTGILLISLVSAGGLILVTLLVINTVRTLTKHEQALRAANSAK